MSTDDFIAAHLKNREKEYRAFLFEWNRLVTLGVQSGFMETHNVWSAPIPPERVLGQARIAQHAVPEASAAPEG